jgi:hypothetical protein
MLLNFECSSNDNIEMEAKISKKKITITDYNTESSTKLDNKLEISVGGAVSSTRHFDLISPMSNKSVRNTSSNNSLKLLHNDSIKFTKVNNNQKLPLLRIATDVTVSAIQIRQVFISEMIA